MLVTPSGTSGCPDTDRQRRLAAQLADMVPGAVTIRVGLDDPRQTWPHPYVIVKDEAGETLQLRPTAARAAARWIQRVWPEADWTRPHTFVLADATLTCTDLIATRRGR